MTATEDAGWRPSLPPGGGVVDGGQPGSGPAMVPDGRGGFAPAPTAYRPTPEPPGVATRPGAGYAGGYAEGGRPGELAPRGGPGGAEPGGRPGGVGSGVGSGVANAASPGARGPAGLGAVPPMMGAGGLGGQQREHRNSTYIPSDEPFVVHFDDVAPAVIGLPEEPSA